ncbi:MAG: hypothetical protein IT160_00585 [Bryobacterales bacterium]|nr:hypothetical protein [Bryobacterales bacterium]
MAGAKVRLLAFALLPELGFGGLEYSIRTLAGSNSPGDGGAAVAAYLGEAAGIACDSGGNLYVADAIDHRVRRITPSGRIETWAGTGVSGFSGDGGEAANAQLSFPYGVALDKTGNLYIADLGNARVRRVTPGGTISTVAGGGTLTGDGIPAVYAALAGPRNVTVSSDDTLYISDFSANRVISVSRDGMLHYVAGTGVAGLSGDGESPLLAQLRNPAGLVFDRSGWLYIADSGNRRIRRVANGRIGSIIAPGPELTLYTPTDVAADAAGNVYVADGRIDETLCVSRLGAVTSIRAGSRALAIGPLEELYLGLGPGVRRRFQGVISTVAGRGSYTYGGDGGAAEAARLWQPSGVAVDAAGSVYIADTANHRIRRVNTAGEISTFAGTGTAGFGGDGKPAAAAQLNAPAAVAVDGAFNLYILDSGNQRIRKVTPEGIINTIAGTGLPGYAGDGGPALSAEFDSPSAMVIDGSGALWIADTGNHRVRRIGADGLIMTVAGNGIKDSSGDGGRAVDASLDSPRGLAVDEEGNLYIADTSNRRLRRVNSSGGIDAWGDGEWSVPVALALDADSGLLVADAGLQRIRRIDPGGSAATIAGDGQAGFAGDGGPAAQGRLNGPSSMAVLPSGDILVADSANNRIRVLTPASAAAPVTSSGAPIPVLNAASLLDGPIAPGELVELTAGSAAEGAMVSFGGYAAPVIKPEGGRLVVQVPYEVADSEWTLLRVERESAAPIERTLEVARAAPGIYAANGKGQAVAFNQDGTANSLPHAAARGSLVTIYCTGAGGAQPGGISGQIAGADAEVADVREAAGQPGVLELKIRVPDGFLPSGVVPLMISTGGRSSQPGVTLVIE